MNSFYIKFTGPCFVMVAKDMMTVYAPYCRDHDDAIALLGKVTTVLTPFTLMLGSSNIHGM